jgi:hypothetical protein
MHSGLGLKYREVQGLNNKNSRDTEGNSRGLRVVFNIWRGLFNKNARRRGIGRLWPLDHARATQIRSGISANRYVTISIGLKSNGANTLRGDLIVALAFGPNDPTSSPNGHRCF